MSEVISRNNRRAAGSGVLYAVRATDIQLPIQTPSIVTHKRDSMYHWRNLATEYLCVTLQTWEWCKTQFGNHCLQMDQNMFYSYTTDFLKSDYMRRIIQLSYIYMWITGTILKLLFLFTAVNVPPSVATYDHVSFCIHVLFYNDAFGESLNRPLLATSLFLHRMKSRVTALPALRLLRSFSSSIPS
jgi:hypothetical protein